MTYSDIITEARRIVKASSASFPISEITQSANSALERITALIRNAQGRWQWDDSNQTTLPFATTSTTSGTGDVTLDIAHQRIDKVEYMDANGAYYTLIPFDISDARCQSYSQLVSTAGEPIMYDKVGESLILAPKPNRDSTIKVSYERGPTYFSDSDTTKSPGFNPLFHRLIPMWCAFDYANINNLDIANRLYSALVDGRRTGLINDLEGEMVTFYSQRARDEHIGLRTRDSAINRRQFR